MTLSHTTNTPFQGYSHISRYALANKYLPRGQAALLQSQADRLAALEAQHRADMAGDKATLLATNNDRLIAQDLAHKMATEKLKAAYEEMRRLEQSDTAAREAALQAAIRCDFKWGFGIFPLRPAGSSILFLMPLSFFSPFLLLSDLHEQIVKMSGENMNAELLSGSELATVRASEAQFKARLNAETLKLSDCMSKVASFGKKNDRSFSPTYFAISFAVFLF